MASETVFLFQGVSAAHAQMSDNSAYDVFDRGKVGHEKGWMVR